MKLLLVHPRSSHHPQDDKSIENIQKSRLHITRMCRNKVQLMNMMSLHLSVLIMLGGPIFEVLQDNMQTHYRETGSALFDL